MEEKVDTKVIENAQLVVGKELKYKELCEALDIPVKTSNSKTAQLKWLDSFTDLTKLNSPTRYRIDRVHPDIFAVLDKISRDECQAAFDAALYCKMLSNEGYPLYISNLELLFLFNEINEDFLQLRGLSPDNVEAQIGNVVYSILTVWTQRRLESMVNREIIRMMDGYRVYTKHFTKEGLMYLKKHDVAIHSDRSNKETLDGLCDKIYQKSFKETFTTLIWKDKHNKAHNNPKIIPYLWPEFNDKMNKAIKKETGGKYVKLKRVKVIFPPDDKILVELLNNYFKKTKALNPVLIKQESKKKVLSSQKMKQFALKDVEEFIEEFMK